MRSFTYALDVSATNHECSGKSSLILTLLNFLEYTGIIEIDGTDISTISRQQLRSLITTIPQDILELPGTLRYNLLTANGMQPPDDVVIAEVLEKVRLRDHVDAHGGLDAPLVNMGFSHGQKQLLAIARAILHKLANKSGLLLVDEATSGMDHETADVMQEVMNEFFGSCTVISISHRPESIRNSDVVIDIDDGRVVCVAEHGSSEI